MILLFNILLLIKEAAVIPVTNNAKSTNNKIKPSWSLIMISSWANRVQIGTYYYYRKTSMKN